MARITTEQITTIPEIWQKLDLLKRPEAPIIVETLLKEFLRTGLITDQTDVFLFDSFPLYHFVDNKKSNFGKNQIIPLLVHSGLADYIFSIPESCPPKYKKIVENIRGIFEIGPYDFDIKIGNLNDLHWQTTIDWLSENSQMIHKCNESDNFFFTNPIIWNQSHPYYFPHIEELNNLPKNKNNLPVIKAKFLSNIDEHHPEDDEENHLKVICLELGHANEEEFNNEKYDSFVPQISIHISNIPKHDTRLQLSPNSNLAEVQPRLKISEDLPIEVDFQEQVIEKLLLELDLILDREKPIESFIAAISFFRKINIDVDFQMRLLEMIWTQYKIKDAELLNLIARSPLLLIYIKLKDFLESLEEKIKITSEYDILRFCSDLSVLALTLGKRDFYKLIVQTGIISYLDKPIIEILNRPMLVNQVNKTGIIWISSSISTVEDNIKFAHSYSISSHIATANDPDKWDGISASINPIEDQYSDYPLLSFITHFCKPFFD